MQLNNSVKKDIKNFDGLLGGLKPTQPPVYDPKTHYLEITKTNGYYQQLSILRHIVKLLCEDYMSRRMGAINADLFMLTPSVSSPMGPGSDSEAIPIKFGNLNSYLTDSSQFGFEPMIMGGLNKVYCYLPSMRGEDPDNRHLNQFFHCEIEIAGNLEDIIEVAENYVCYLSAGMLESPNLLQSLSMDYERTVYSLQKILTSKKFKRICFDDACKLLIEHGYKKFINVTDHGMDISSTGEQELMRILKMETPLWLTHFDRDRVPFYQKPDPNNKKKVLNADLLFPPISQGGFGGEILGAGQRQDNTAEMYESLNNQGLSSEPYEWYINLRNQKEYKISSGFGLGIERYIAWSLGLASIKDVILYPRLKNILTTP